MTHDLNKLLKVLAKIGTSEQLHIAYEAGPAGFGLQRALKERGYVCETHLHHRRSRGVRARDCIPLAECSRAGQLSAVWIPDPGDEAIRDLSRRAKTRVTSRVQARHQLKGFLLRHDIRYTGRTSWALPTTAGWRRRTSAAVPLRRRSPSIGRRSRPPTSAWSG